MSNENNIYITATCLWIRCYSYQSTGWVKKSTVTFVDISAVRGNFWMKCHTNVKYKNIRFTTKFHCSVSIKMTTLYSFNAVVTCEMKLFQNSSTFEIILFQRVKTCLKLFQNYFTGLLQLTSIFQHVQCHWNNYEIVVVFYLRCNQLRWLHVKYHTEIILKLFISKRFFTCNHGIITTHTRHVSYRTGSWTIAPGSHAGEEP